VPNREIREAIRHSEKVSQLSDGAYRLFTLLLTCADDYGRYPADPRLVKAACYPYDCHTLANVDKCLTELSDKGIIRLYSVEEKQYLVIQQWKQRIRANKSKYPEPNDLEKCPTNDGQVTDTRARGTNNEERITVDWDNVKSRWNTLATQYNFPTISTLSDSRRKQYLARIKAHPDLWDALTKEVPLLDEFVHKGNWFNFDWWTKSENNYLKLAEGNYRRKTSKRRGPNI